MALIKCPKCGNQISDKAITCPHCGVEIQRVYAEIRDQKKKRKHHFFRLLLIFFLVVILAGLAYLFYTGALNMVPKRTDNESQTFQKWKQTTPAGDPVFKAEGVSFVMKLVEGGSFQMGEADDDEKPIHSVTVNSFYMCETEVTQALWKAVMGMTVSQQRDLVDHSKPLRGVGDNYPMYYVNWYECQDFIFRLNQYTGQHFRFPTEAEWEYAAKGGAHKNRSDRTSGRDLKSVAWYADNSNESSHQVKSKSPNSLGLYDMIGNVWEWCQDWYGSYQTGSQTAPQGPSTGSKRVLRGGSWYSPSSSCRVSKRHKLDPSYRDTCYGLRLVMDP